MPAISMNNKTTVSESGGNFVYNNGYLMPIGKFVNVSHFYNQTRTALSDRSSDVIWTFNVTKLYDENTTNLHLYCMLIGKQNYSDVCGIFVHIPGSTTRSDDGTAFHDIWYLGGNDSGETHAACAEGKEFPNLPAGSHRVEIGWQSRAVDAGNKPFVIWNHNSSDDARQHQNRSNCVIYEVKR